MQNLIHAILTQPTAPFRESWVKRACLWFCSENGLPAHEDATGNLWVGARTPQEARKSSLIFVAHMDHPGMVVERFEVLRNGRVRAHALWLGGGPLDIRNHQVKVFSDVNALMVFEGRVAHHTRGTRGPDQVTIALSPSSLAAAACTPRGLRSLGPWGACLWYDQKGVPQGITQSKGMWVTKAADDLIGVCAALDAYRQAGAPKGVCLLLTRAEESGFHGTLEVLRKKCLNPARTAMISIETSSALPGAEIGLGPVVRLGDKATVFDPSLVYWLEERARELKAKKPAFRYQRRVMDLGTCEASAFNAFGFRVAGISTPLRNYHNMAPNGLKPAPEAVSQADVAHLSELVAHVMKSAPTTKKLALGQPAFGDFRGRMMKNHHEHQRFFKPFR